MTQTFNLHAEKNVYQNGLDEETIQNDKLLQKFAIGVYEGNRDQIPKDWRLIKKADDPNSGFYAEAYERNGKIVIVYRGTNDLTDWIKNNKDMVLNKFPAQLRPALNFYDEVVSEYTKKGYSVNDITVTGHSLGGSLCQLVCDLRICKGVTFNAYGTEGILQDKKYVSVRNYGNEDDLTFTYNLHRHPGKTYVIENTSLEILPQIRKYHSVEDMGDIATAVPYDMSKHHKDIDENMHPRRVLVVEEVMNRKNSKPNDAFAKYFYNQAKKGYTMWEKDIKNKIKSGEVFVHSYTKQNGTYVQEYYRNRPHF